MAAALEQSDISVVTGVNSQALSFPGAVTAGNLVVVGCSSYAGDLGTGAVTDNQANTYTRMTYDNYGGSGTCIATYYCENVSASGTFTVTVNPDDTAADLSFVIMEFSDIASSSSLDSTNNARTTSSSPNSGTVNTGVSGSLYVGTVNHGGTDRSITEGSGWTLIQENEGGSSDMPIGTEYRVSDAGDYAATWTLGSSTEWAAHVAAFLAGGGGPTPSTVPAKYYHYAHH